MSDHTIGLFALDTAERTARGYLLPWGTESVGVSASSTPPIRFARGHVNLPTDPMIVGLNEEHGRFNVIGRATKLEDHETGIWAEFTIANTAAGDAWLDDHGNRAYFSAELDNMTRDDTGHGTGDLVGAAVTAAPAFHGTGLFSLAPTAEPDTADAPAEPDTEPDTDTDNGEEIMPDATVPDAARRRNRSEKPAPLTAAGFFSAYRDYRRNGDIATLRPFAEAAENIGLFALNDVQFDGPGGLIEVGGHPGAWLGELWQGRSFARRITPLITSGTLTAMKATGWTWLERPEVEEWLGNKAPVPSADITVKPEEFAAQRFAGGHDLAREYYDFGMTEVIDSYARAMVDSYARKSDQYVLDTLLAGATVVTPDAATENIGLSAIIDLSLEVVAAGASPSFSIVAPDVFKSIAKTPSSDALEYFGAAVGVETGTAGGFSVVPDSRLDPGTLIVGAREAATAWELPGSPIRVSVPDIVNGGIDNAFHGYIAAGVTYPAALVTGSIASGT